MSTRDWFEELTGFREHDYAQTRSRLRVEGDELVSTVNDARYGIGTLSVPTLAELRSRNEIPVGGRSTVRCVVGDARALHADPELEGALFQVASQFNLLEMTDPNITPEDGGTRYADDPTQGPACATAAAAATIYRNYFAPVDGETGQTRGRQIDALRPMGEALASRLGRPVSDLWTMSNGYALCTGSGLDAIAGLLAGCTDDERDELRARLAIGVHRDVEVTDVHEGARRLVSQAFCSALPVAYGGGPRSSWEAFARLVLEASYEATMLSAVEQSVAGGSNVVLLTRVGGGVFGNGVMTDNRDRAGRPCTPPLSIPRATYRASQRRLIRSSQQRAIACRTTSRNALDSDLTAHAHSSTATSPAESAHWRSGRSARPWRPAEPGSTSPL